MDEVKIWVIEDSQAAPLNPAGRIENERLLEETLVKHPDLLMEGVTLVGRQTPTDGGPLDLLGVDDEGRLVVFELKRGTLSRDAVAQVIDYASYLDAMDVTDLAEYISERSGAHGIDKIEDFQGWYSQAFDELESLKPLRMFLVGLGADDKTERMVNFLANNSDMDMSLLTFHGFDYEGKIILAKQVEIQRVEDFDPRPTSRRLGRPERQAKLDNRVDGFGIRELFDDVKSMFEANWPQSEQIAQMQTLRIELPRYANSGSHRLPYARIKAHDERVGVVFFRRAFVLCVDEFNDLIEQIPFLTFPRNLDPLQEARTADFLLTAEEWETHKEKLTAFVQSVYKAWQNREGDEQVVTQTRRSG